MVVCLLQVHPHCSGVSDNGYASWIDTYRAQRCEGCPLRSQCFKGKGNRTIYVSAHSRDGYWGSNAIENIAKGLQQELPGLRGFSTTNIKNMRIFYEQWSPYLNRQTLSDDLISSSLLDVYVIRQLTTAEFPMDDFMSVGFSQHMEIIFKANDLNEQP